MIEVVALVEGETEATFVNDCLRSHLAAQDVQVWARLPGRVRRRGGVRSWELVRGDILRTLRERRGRICTTMFDFYGLPCDWPGRDEATGASVERKGPIVEGALLEDLSEKAGEDFRRELFIPYVQVHEFEALLFSDVGQMVETLNATGTANGDVRSALQQCLDDAGQPEAINDNFHTCPSRRITGVVSGYQKPLHGPIIAGRIGLDLLRNKCPHFGDWLTRLEQLPNELQGVCRP